MTDFDSELELMVRLIITDFCDLKEHFHYENCSVYLEEDKFPFYNRLNYDEMVTKIAQFLLYQPNLFCGKFTFRSGSARSYAVIRFECEEDDTLFQLL